MHTGHVWGALDKHATKLDVDVSHVACYCCRRVHKDSMSVLSSWSSQPWNSYKVYLMRYCTLSGSSSMSHICTMFSYNFGFYTHFIWGAII